MITLLPQLKDDLIELFKDNEEYSDIIIKEQYEVYPETHYPIITISELNNEDINQYSNDSGEQVSYLSYQIRIACEQSENKTAIQNVQSIGEIIDNYLKGERYWCLRRVGNFIKQPLFTDNNVMYGFLRYECNVDINTNTIYRRY